MNSKKVVLFCFVVLLNLPLVARKSRRTRLMPEKELEEMVIENGGFRPEKVDKDMRVKALEIEKEHIKKSIDKLEKIQSGVQDTDGKEAIILKLRLTLKKGYFGNVQQILDVETGKKKFPEMMGQR